MAIGLGTRLGPYEILAPIGAGGMGQVWKARDTRLGRIVAVKVLPAELSSDAKLRVRFDAEAKAISALSHPYICALYDVGPDYLVMEHCEGKTLAKRLRGGPLPIELDLADTGDGRFLAAVPLDNRRPPNIVITNWLALMRQSSRR
jgi:serine/threonine protein kinase